MLRFCRRPSAACANQQAVKGETPPFNSGDQFIPHPWDIRGRRIRITPALFHKEVSMEPNLRDCFSIRRVTPCESAKFSGTIKSYPDPLHEFRGTEDPVSDPRPWQPTFATALPEAQRLRSQGLGAITVTRAFCRSIGKASRGSSISLFHDFELGMNRLCTAYIPIRNRPVETANYHDTKLQIPRTRDAPQLAQGMRCRWTGTESLSGTRFAINTASAVAHCVSIPGYYVVLL